MKAQIFAALVAVFALAGCDSNRDNVRDAQKDLSETRQEASQEVREAQGEAVKDINDTKESAASDIRNAQKDLQEAQRDAANDMGSTSGVTTGVNNSGDVKVSPEQCAQFATNRTISPDKQALYDACAKMDPDKYGKAR